MKEYFAFLQTYKEYPKQPPYNPPELYPEYPFKEIDKNNNIYDSIRNLFSKLQLDSSNYGNKNWNPLGELIKPGNNVIIKPNLVSEPRSNETNFESIITHTSIIRPVVDYCLIALKEKGSLIIADSPQFDSNFEQIKKLSNLKETLRFINERSLLKVDLLDLRQEKVIMNDGIITERIKLNGDPKGYFKVDLGENSEFWPIENHLNRIYGADYDYEETRNHHSHGKHEYCISRTVLNSDVVINIPKLKTHKSAGITVSLKNIVGINGNKNYLPHFRFGSIKEGGDEFPRKSVFSGLKSNLQVYLLNYMSDMGYLQKGIMRLFGKFYKSLGPKNPLKFNNGSWYGNDTLWRTIVDLNKILFYANKEGVIQPEVQRKNLSIVDGIIAGEGNGPIFPNSKPCGVLLGGNNPFTIDMNAATIMGFDWKKIPSINKSKNILLDNSKIQDENIFNLNLKFEPPSNWDYILL